VNSPTSSPKVRNMPEINETNSKLKLSPRGCEKYIIKQINICERNEPSMQ
jgi:hypothetical protein